MSDIPNHLHKQTQAARDAGDERPSTAPPTSAPTTTEVSYENFEFGFTAREQAEGQPVEFDLSVVIDRREAGEPRIKVDIDLGMQNATDVVGGLVTSLAQLLKTAADEASEPKVPIEDLLSRIRRRRAADKGSTLDDPDDWEDFLRNIVRGIEKDAQARRILREAASVPPVRTTRLSDERPAQRPPLREDTPKQEETPAKKPDLFERLFDDLFGEKFQKAVGDLFGDSFDDLFRRKPR